jgi:hypothetical protein
MPTYKIIKGTNGSFLGKEIKIDNFIENSYIEVEELDGRTYKIKSIPNGGILLRNEHITLTGKIK